MHGNPDNLIAKDGTAVSPAELLERLLSDGWKYGQTIQLYACQTGKGENSFAERLAAISGGTVIAPTEWIFVNRATGLVDGVWTPFPGTTPTQPFKWWPGYWKGFRQ